ncbi:MAG TPA: TonB family protein [Geobacteraceae bacterium]
MDAFIDREFQQPSLPVRSSRSRDFFGRMVAISLIIHVISSIILMSPQRSSVTAPAVSYLDLQDMKSLEQANPAPAKEQKTEKIAEQHQTADQAAEPPALPGKPLSEAEKLVQDVKQSLADAEKNPESLQERSFGLGLTNGYFSSIAQGESLRADIREYYFSMLRQINEKWWLNKESQRGTLRGAVISIVIAKNGVIMQKTLVRSSGNPAFDKAMLKSIDAAGPLPPLPETYGMDYFTAPLRFRGPLDLFTS